jgi:hypothetical protein
MDPRTVEINNLRILNDYLNQTIETMVRAQRNGVGQFSANGLSHSPFAGVVHFGASPFATNGVGFDPTHATFNPYVAQHVSPFGVGGTLPIYASMIDPFVAQRALSQAAAFGAGGLGSIGMLGNQLGSPYSQWNTQWNPIAELAQREQLVRQQQQLQALAGYQALTGGYRGAWGIPV